jgi:hypothetical protein
MKIEGDRLVRGHGDSDDEASRASLEPKDKLAALGRILRSSTFSTAESIRQILRFIVEQSISDREHEIKE